MVTMGFLDIFRSAPVKQFTIGEAVVLIRSELESLQRKNKEEAYRSALKIHGEISHLVELIEEFSRKEVYDRAKSSAAVKERFCSLSKKQLTSLEKPEKENSFLFLQSVRSILENLGGLTQRQVLHINFFFREDFKPAAKKLKEITTLLDVAGGGVEHQKAISLFENIGNLEKKKAQLSDLIVSDEDKLKIAKEKHKVLPQLPKQPDSYELDKAESTLKSLKQEVDSLLAIQKTLKKCAYISGIKDELLEMYIESPNAALVQDKDLRILDFANQASTLIQQGKIENDKRLEAVLSSVDYLKRKREELISAKAAAEEEGKKFRHAQELFEASLKARTNHIAELEGEIKDLEKSLRAERQEAAATESELAKSRAELYMLASKLLNATIV